VIDAREGADANPRRLRALRKVRIASIERERQPSEPRDLWVSGAGGKLDIVRIHDGNVELVDEALMRR